MRKSQAKVLTDAITAEIAALEGKIKRDEKARSAACARADKLYESTQSDRAIIKDLRGAMDAVEAVTDRHY